MVITLKKDSNGTFLPSSSDVLATAISDRPASIVLSNEPEGEKDIFDMLANSKRKTQI